MCVYNTMEMRDTFRFVTYLVFISHIQEIWLRKMKKNEIVFNIQFRGVFGVFASG